MSPKERSGESSSVRRGARRAAAQLRPVAARVKPLAASTGAVAGRQLRRTRAWAAPQVERSGQVLQHKVAPKVSALMSSAAQRLEPSELRQRRWRRPAGLAAASRAATAFVRSRMRRDDRTSADQAGSDEVVQPAPTHDGQPPVSTDTDTNTRAS